MTIIKTVNTMFPVVKYETVKISDNNFQLYGNKRFLKSASTQQEIDDHLDRIMREAI